MKDVRNIEFMKTITYNSGVSMDSDPLILKNTNKPIVTKIIYKKQIKIIKIKCYDHGQMHC